MKNYLSKIDPGSLRTLFSQAPVALAMITGKDLVIEAANEKILELWGKDDTAIGKKLLEAIPELEGQKFPDLLIEVLETGIVYKGTGEKALLKGQELYFDFTYAPVYHENTIVAVSVVAAEVTERIVVAEKLRDSEIRYRDLIENADVSTAIYLGEDLVIGMANEKMLKTWGRDASVIGMKLEEALPELEGQPFIALLQKVYRTGETYAATEDKVQLVVDGSLQTFFYNFSYKPIRDAHGKIYGILNMAVEVTDQVNARMQAQQSEALLNSFIKNAPMSVSIMKGPDHIITVSNKKTMELWNGSADRLGKSILDAYPQMAGSQTFANVKKCYEDGVQISVKDHQIKNPDGSVKYINYLLEPLKNDKGATEYVISIGYDVTEDMLLREQVMASEAQLRTLANQLPQLIWMTNAEGYTYYYSDRWYEYTGMSRDVFGDESWQMVMPPEQQQEAAQKWKHSFETGANFEMEQLLADGKNPGSYRWFLTKAVPVKDKNGRTTQWVGSCTDIHELKELQSQKDTFLGITSHELKTPLTSIKVYSQLLEKSLTNAGDGKNATLAKRVDEQVNKLNSLIADLLDVTKMQKGHLQLNESDFNFDVLVQEVVEEVQITSDKQILITGSDAGIVHGDRHRLAQVIINLITNAVKYSPGADKVLIHATSVQDKVTLCVEDFGIGLESDHTEKIFQQYYRVGDNRQNTFPGLGLGLYISAQIIKRTGGRIWVNSTPGVGSRFCFEIPKLKNISLQ